MQGRIYGIACLSGQEANGYGLWISGSLLTESGFAYDPDHIYTLEELDLLFASLKERYPDSYPLGTDHFGADVLLRRILYDPGGCSGRGIY